MVVDRLLIVLSTFRSVVMLTRHTLGLDVGELLWIQFRLLVITKLGLWIVQEVPSVVGVGLWR